MYGFSGDCVMGLGDNNSDGTSSGFDYKIEKGGCAGRIWAEIRQNHHCLFPAEEQNNFDSR